MKIRNIFIFLLFVLSFLLLSCGTERQKIPKAEKGIVNLRGYDFSTGKSIPLDGEWNFCWKELLSPAEMCKKNTVIYQVPGSWQTSKAEKRSSNGYGTLSLVIKKDKTSVPLALKIPSISSSYKLWIDDKVVCENGKVAESENLTDPLWLPRVVVLPNSEDERICLTLQISNFHDRRDGFWGSIMMGTSYNINRMRDFSIAFELFLFGSLFIMALYHFCLFLLRRNDKSILYFAVICFLLAIRTVTGGECFLTFLTGMSSIVVYKTLFIAFFFIVPAIVMYFLKLYPDEVWKKLSIVSVGLAILSFIMIFMPLKVVTETVFFFELLILVFFAYFTVCLISAVINRREGAVIFLIGWLIFTGTGINDILFDMGIIWTGLIAPFGLIFFIFSQAFLLSMRYANAFKTIEVMSERLMSLDVLKDEFLANTSHELKTPLSGIIGLAGSLIEGARGRLSDEVKADLFMIETSGRRLTSLVNDILDFSKLKNRDMVLKESEVDIKSIIDSVIYLSRPLLKKTDIVLKNNIKHNLPLILGDENRLQQVFYNLVGNAVKFTQSGRIEIDAEVKFFNDQKIMIISVSDTGIGIEKDKLSTIFDAFQQADGGISRNYGGTGIGLSITRQLIDLHGGSIEVESEIGKGSVFIVKIPFKERSRQFLGIRAEEEIKTVTDSKFLFEKNEVVDTEELIDNYDQTLFPYTEQDTDESSKKRSTVLIVDDDPVNLQVLENYLGLANYVIKKTRDGHEAINIAEVDSSIDIVLLDIMMPRITGYDVAKKLREKYSHFELPIIMLTAKNQIADIVDGIEAGANDYLSKPFDRRELLARVETLLILKESVRESKKLASIEHELSIARKIQFSTMPSSTPKLDSIDMAVRYAPMETVGGDFYSFHVPSDEKIGILLTDVSGHGVPAALIASMLKIVSNMLIEYAETPDLFLSEMNRILTGNMGSQFLTAVYVLIDTEKKILLQANAGHEPVIILKREQGIVVEDNPRGRIMGWIKDDNIELSSVKLESRDRIILFTDCITESFNDKKELFGIESFKKRILETIEMDAEECADYLLSILEDWTGNKDKFDDDFSLIVVDLK